MFFATYLPDNELCDPVDTIIACINQEDITPEVLEADQY